MYATCTFCHGALGRNESIEVFPVGRRLAYDAGKGRLWVVCTQCGQWNLSPLEERWEAIENAERQFRASKLRHSTDNIGLAKLADGTELIRIGNPLRPEMAAWRYGQNFLRRWHTMAAGAGVGAAVAGGFAVMAPAAGLAAVATIGLAAVSGATTGAVLTQAFRSGAKFAFSGPTILDNEHQYIRVPPKELGLIRLIADEKSWALHVPFESRRPTIDTKWRDYVSLGSVGSVTISGQDGVNAARQLLPYINGRGARVGVVNEAVKLAGSWPNVEHALTWSLQRSKEVARTQLFGDPGSLYHLPGPVRLGLEMSLHEAQEQRALDGELAELERAWRDAEIIAGISDGLFLPGRIERVMKSLKGRNPLA